MIELGKTNHLSITRTVEYGVYLDAGPLGEVLLPNKDLPADHPTQQPLDVFIYLDTNDRLIATTQTPKLQLGQCAYLRLIEVNKIGAFFDWGLPKDLLVPYAEQSGRLIKDQSYVVYLYRDNASGRLVGSTKLSRHLKEFSTDFKDKQSVDLLICGRSELGYKAVINQSHLGLIHISDVFKPLKLGQQLKGYIKEIRPDHKINLCLQLPNKSQLSDLGARILQDLEQNDGTSTLTDKSDPQLIYDKWNVSKGSYKKAIGGLYKQRKIEITPTHIKLVN